MTRYIAILTMGLILTGNAWGATPWLERQVEESTVQRVLFVHEGAPRATFLALGESEGGVAGARELATPVADQGYNSLIFAYFGKPATRKSFVRVPLEDFFTAIEWLKNQPFVRKGRVGLIGGSAYPGRTEERPRPTSIQVIICFPNLTFPPRRIIQLCKHSE